MTQEDVAKLTENKYQTIQKYENGIITNMPLSQVEKLANALKMSPGELIGWVDKSKPTAKNSGELTDDEIMLVKWYRSSSQERREAAKDILKPKG